MLIVWVMTLPRSMLVDRHATPYYHCVSRCVRRAFLCGEDPDTGYDFEHRRAWIENRLHALARVFDIDVCAYAVMSNHYHLVVHLGLNHRAWTSDEVAARWGKIYRLPEGFELWPTCRQEALVTVWRDRLGSLSWFMRCVNEPLARLANKEDGCKGRFWEGRFRSQALLDEASVIKCMAYVDLNPVRALLADRPERSEYTSVLARIERRDQALAPMAGSGANEFSLPIAFADYLELVDWTGRQLRPDKRGSISFSLPPIVTRLTGSGVDSWMADMKHLTRRYCRAIGGAESLLAYRERLGQERLNGLAA